MTREERKNAIRHINSALDVDDWAKERAVEALSVDWGKILKEMYATETILGGGVEYNRGLFDGICKAGSIIEKHLKAAKGGEK